jgi:SAM-dependent methyltransferase
MDWPYEIAERDHDIQNPMSAERIRLLGEYLRLDGDSRVLDIACGKAGPALILASTFGCKITGIELRERFADEARARIAARGLQSLIEVHTADGASVPIEPEAWDAALCLGATFVWGTMGDAAAVLVPAVRPGGFVAIGEPYWRRWPVPDGIDSQTYVDLPRTIARLADAGVALTGLIAAADDDWDRYESLHWRALEEWLETQADVEEIRAAHIRRRDEYFKVRRPHLGWAIFVGRKPSH